MSGASRWMGLPFGGRPHVRLHSAPMTLEWRVRLEEALGTVVPAPTEPYMDSQWTLGS